ncbi:MAG: hypothetical protein LBP67_08235 [Bacteroidales bacterium]|nr:hypothetical protein [Bacteroidales bacterium]
MKVVSSPEVTLETEARGIPQGGEERGFLDWLCSFVAYGDDGNTYWFGTALLILAHEGVDMWNIECSWKTGKVIQVPGSIYKLADFPEVGVTGRTVLPGGSHKVSKTDKEVLVQLGDFNLICKDDNSWHYNVEDKAKGIKAEFVHYGKGCPLWYGKEEPSYLTPHSIAYGYNWSGVVEGTLTIDGKKINIKGAGVRERYIAVDSSAAEIGGWEDWMWFHFDEVFGSMYEMKMGIKDMVLNLTEEKQSFPVGNFNIEHSEWAFLPALGAFMPMHYKITMEVEAGILEFTANAIGATVWGVTGEVPSTPVCTLNWDKPQGTFTYKDGRKKALTNGFGGTSVRQFKAYPDVFGTVLAKGNIFKDPSDFKTL